MGGYSPRMVMITGATSDFGIAFAKRFAEAGCALVLHGRNTEKLEALAAELASVRTHLMLADLAKPDEIESAFAAIPDDLKDIDLLINNAGGALGLDKFHEMSLGDADAMIDANCRSLVHLTRLVLPRMVRNRRGHVINIGSVAGRNPYPGGNVYGACKAFVHQLTFAIRCDLVGTDVRMTSLEPGLAETGFSVKRFKGDEARAAQVYAGTRALSPDDVADAAYFAATMPPHVNINIIEMMPTKQSWAALTVERE